MTRYLLQATTEQAQAAAAQAIESWLARVLQQLGGRLQSVDCTLGQYDLVLVVEAPNEAAVAALAELAARTGRFSVRQSLPLVSPEEARAALAAASSAPVMAPHPARLPAMAPIAAAQPAITAMPTAAAVEPSITAMPTAAELEPSTSAVPSLAEVEPAAAEVEPLVGPAMPAGAGEMPPGSYELVAGRFTHFSDLGAFSETLQALPGVRSMSTQQFVRGMVSLRVHYDNPIPLLTRLRELQQFRPDVREIGPSQIEMVIFAGPQAAPAPAAAPAVVARPKPTVLEEAEAVASHAWSAPAPALAAGLLHPTAVTECVTPGSGKFAVNARALAMATTVAAAAVGLLASLLGL